MLYRAELFWEGNGWKRWGAEWGKEWAGSWTTWTASTRMSNSPRRWTEMATFLSLTSITGDPFSHWAMTFTENWPTANYVNNPSNKQVSSLHDDKVHFQGKKDIARSRYVESSIYLWGLLYLVKNHPQSTSCCPNDHRDWKTAVQTQHQKAMDCFPGLPAAFVLWSTTSSWRPQVYTASYVDVVRSTLDASPLRPEARVTGYQRHIWPR